MQSEKKTQSWDVIESTFYWTITLDMQHPLNRTTQLVGYSKAKHQQEATDKIALLQRCISRLYLRGYFKRMVKMEIYQNVGRFIDKRTDPIILTLFPFHCEFSKDRHNHDIIFKQHGTWLQQFFECINKDKDITHLIPAGRKMKTHDDFLKVEKYFFTHISQLYAHASRLLSNGHPEGAVNDFIHKYKALKSW